MVIMIAVAAESVSLSSVMDFELYVDCWCKTLLLYYGPALCDELSRAETTFCIIEIIILKHLG